MAHAPHETHKEHAAHTHEPHVVPIPIYAGVYVALLVLLIITYLAAQQDFGRLNLLIALIIAIIKTTLVVLFFMGVKYNSKLTWLWASIGFIWLIALFLTMGDYITREWIRLPQGW